MCGPGLWRRWLESTSRKKQWWNKGLRHLSQFFSLLHISRLRSFQGRKSLPRQLTNPRLTIWKNLTKEPLYPRNKISNVKLPAHWAELPDNALSFIVCPLTPRGGPWAHLNFGFWQLTFNLLWFSPRSKVVLPHQRLKIWPQHSHLFSRTGDIPLMAL